MHKLKDFRIEIDRRTDSEGAGGDLRVWMRWGLKNEDAPLPWMSFLMLGEEWRDLFEARLSEFTDGYHKLSIFDESWTFYNLEVPREDVGTMPIRYVRICMPHPVRRMIAERIAGAIARYDSLERSDKWPAVLDLTPELEEWSEHYGRGKGSIDLQASTETRDALGRYSGEESFDRCMETVNGLALATTNSITDKAPVSLLVRDWSGKAEFSFSAGRLHGGIINHGTEEAPEWSVHT